MKKMLLMLLLAPAILLAQPSVTKHNGTYTIDFKKKKAAQDSTTVTQTTDDEDEDGTQVKSKKKAKPIARPKPPGYKPYTYDIRHEGVFKGLFMAGLNTCQIDGDNEWGYKYLGAEAGVGVMARFHPFMSVSMEIDYTMKGARSRLLSTSDVSRYYQVQLDYVSVPVAFNFHAKDIAILSAGLAPGVLTRYKEFNEDGINVTGHSPWGDPRNFDLDIFTGIHFVIKKHYALGFKYSYSLISIRKASPGTHVNGQFNNDLTFRFMYILGPVKKK
jgi:Outer membrane protein beta-barrel domain